jgi:hypothetical protein
MLTAYCFHHHGTLMIEAASASETSVNFYHTTLRNNQEDSHFHTIIYLE